MSVAASFSSLSDDSLFHEYVANASPNAFRVLRNRHNGRAKQKLVDDFQVSPEAADVIVNRVWRTVTEHRNYLAKFYRFARRFDRLIAIEAKRFAKGEQTPTAEFQDAMGVGGKL